MPFQNYLIFTQEMGQFWKVLLVLTLKNESNTDPKRKVSKLQEKFKKGRLIYDRSTINLQKSKNGEA